MQSPERIRREIAHRSEQLELEKEHVLTTERKAMQIKTKVDEYERLATVRGQRVASRVMLTRRR